MINNIGGHFQKHPGKTSEYVIVGDLDHISKGLKTAKNTPGTNILSEEEFLNVVVGYEWL